ncbi:hypothetical protein OIE66_06535 [Nonomuraea sp. NBC_01738]|uniref:hypothetical protein n=1 Tax=Nonomuraea sp. NBC_01738 TaxID=2976003 RepID=UPI002E1118AF|nr:hypothetical protein OIE66_06535 [Nonomuraea sp. NBC_01738]
MTEAPYDAARLRDATQQTIDMLSHPAFVEAMQAVRKAPADKRLLEGSKRLNPKTLRERGVPLPDYMRISSRYFEEGLPHPINFGDGEGGRPNIVNGLNEAAPGLLDRLRETNQPLFKELVSCEDDEAELLRWGGCACGGGLTFCAGGGFSTLEA